MASTPTNQARPGLLKKSAGVVVDAGAALWKYSKKLLWFGTTGTQLRLPILAAIILLLPIAFEVSHDQAAVLDKLQAQTDTNHGS